MTQKQRKLRREKNGKPTTKINAKVIVLHDKIFFNEKNSLKELEKIFDETTENDYEEI